MTLLITVFAAVICTVLWYTKAPKDEMKFSTLCFTYWGASLMWLVDAIAEYSIQREKFFYPAPADMLNDAFLGCACVVLGMIIWIFSLLVKDPKGILLQSLYSNVKERK